MNKTRFLINLICVLLVLFVFLFTLTSCSETSADENRSLSSLSISGTVSFEGLPLSDVVVYLNGVETTHTNSNGNFYLYEIEKDSEITFFKSGFIFNPQALVVTENKHDYTISADLENTSDAALDVSDDEQADSSTYVPTDDANGDTDENLDVSTQNDEYFETENDNCDENSDAVSENDSGETLSDSSSDEKSEDIENQNAQQLPKSLCAPINLFYSEGIIYWSTEPDVYSADYFEIYMNSALIGTSFTCNFDLSDLTSDCAFCSIEVCAVLDGVRSDFSKLYVSFVNSG
ncbi:MAG: hypothetical protein ACI4MT_04770 [Christensenellales bacterium]